jgi:signal transduction histidine kinase
VKLKPHFSATHLFVVSLAAMLLVAATFVVDTVASRERHLLRATQQLQYSSRMLAMHVARSFDAIEVLLDELTPQLAKFDHGRDWSRKQGHDFLGKHMTRALPQVRFLIVFNADGDQRFTSFSASSPPFNAKDRPHFVQMRDGADRAHYGPYIGRAVNQAGYAVGRRLESPDKHFAGALVAATEPNYFEEFCWSTRPFEKFESALVNTEGKIIGLCRPAAERAQLKSIGDDYRAVLAGGTFAGKIPATHTGPSANDDFVLFAEAVPGYPDLRIINGAPKSLLLAQWHGHLQRSLLLGGTALFALGIAAWLIRRQLLEINSANARLREHRDKLEARVDATSVELNRRRQDERQSAQAKSRFLSAASHDLRQPMQALRLFVGELQRTPAGEQQTLLLQRIEQATDTMGQQLEAMIVLSRLDMADIEAQWENVSMTTVFRRLASIYQPVAEANDVRLVFLPRDAVVHSDPILLIDLLGHLIDNAIKFSPQGVVMVCARRGPAGTTRVEIRDNGSGIEEKDQQTIYEEFFQVGNTARELHAGLGLGLSIANRISLLLKAPIALRSKPGAGSVFSLVLPAASARVSPLPPANPAMPRLLLINAESEIASGFAEQAAEWGYRTEVIDSPESAGSLLSKGGCIVVVFSDDSCTICEKLRTLLRQYPGIVIHPADCQISGIGPYHLAAPVKPARLRALLRSLHRNLF